MFQTTTFVTPTGDFHLTTVTPLPRTATTTIFADGHWYVTDPTPFQQMAVDHGIAVRTITAIYVAVEE